MADLGRYQGKFLQFNNGRWEQFNPDKTGTSFLVITASFQLAYILEDQGLVTKKILVIRLSDAFKYKLIEEKSFLQWRSEDKKAFGFQFQSNDDSQNFMTVLNRVLATTASESPRNSGPITSIKNTSGGNDSGSPKTPSRDRSTDSTSGGGLRDLKQTLGGSSTDIHQYLDELRKENKQIKDMLQTLTDKIDNLTNVCQSIENTPKSMPPVLPAVSTSMSTNRRTSNTTHTAVVVPPPPSSNTAGGGCPPPPPPPPPSSGTTGVGAPPPPPGAPPPTSSGTTGGGAPPPPPPPGAPPPPPPPPLPPPSGGPGPGATLQERLQAKKLKSANSITAGASPPTKPKAPTMDFASELQKRLKKKSTPPAKNPED